MFNRIFVAIILTVFCANSTALADGPSPLVRRLAVPVFFIFSKGKNREDGQQKFSCTGKLHSYSQFHINLKQGKPHYLKYVDANNGCTPVVEKDVETLKASSSCLTDKIHRGLTKIRSIERKSQDATRRWYLANKDSNKKIFDHRVYLEIYRASGAIDSQPWRNAARAVTRSTVVPDSEIEGSCDWQVAIVKSTTYQNFNALDTHKQHVVIGDNTDMQTLFSGEIGSFIAQSLVSFVQARGGGIHPETHGLDQVAQSHTVVFGRGFSFDGGSPDGRFF